MSDKVTCYKLKNEMSHLQLNRAHENDAGTDICCSKDFIIPAKSDYLVSTDLFIQIPDGYVAIVKSRSGLSVKKKIEVGAGVIDSGYRGEILVHLYNHSDQDHSFTRGDRIAQLLIMPVMLGNFIEIDDINDSSRGDKGIGSTGI